MWWPRQQSGRRHSDFARRALRKQAHAIKQGTTYNFCEHAATHHCLSDCCHVCSPLDDAPPKDFVSTEAVPTPNREFYTAIRLPSFGQPWSCVGRRCRPATSQILCRESGARGFVHFPCMFQSLPCGLCLSVPHGNACRFPNRHQATWQHTFSAITRSRYLGWSKTPGVSCY